MTRSSNAGAVATLIVGILLAVIGCDPESPRSSDVTSDAVDVTGTWDVYWTLTGAPERGPYATTWRFLSADGRPGLDGRVGMETPCSSSILPVADAGLMQGTISRDSISLSAGTGSWTGTVSGDTMTGTFVEPRGSGAWRATKVSAARCATYEVWGGEADLGCGSTAGYEPELHGYVLLGSGTGTRTFTGQYPWYYVLTRHRSVALVDAVETFAGTYPAAESTGNAGAYQAISGPPDGQTCSVGTGEQGGYVRIETPTPPPSITVHVAP